MKKAFTLIELLVVVLIIGILAAVAMPNYQRAVDKTRMTGFIQIGRQIKRAQEMYYMVNETYTLDLGDLAADFSKSCSKVDISYLSCQNALIDNIAGASADEDNLAGRAVVVYYCPGNKHETCLLNSTLTYQIYFKHSSNPDSETCSGSGTRGQALCNNLKL